MTEEDAKAKWCPHARSLVVVAAGKKIDLVASCNRVQGIHLADKGENNCIASACMAWRWDWTPEQAARVTVSPQSPAPGHCGLAGAERQ